MEMPKPTPGHALMERLAGTWEGEETMYPSPWSPRQTVAQGSTKGRIALGGFALIMDYEQRRDGVVTFSGHGVMTYDPDAKLYSLHWFDCIGSPPEVFSGRFEGEVLTVAHGGPGMHARLTYDLSEPGRLKSSMEMSQDGTAWNRMFDGVYRLT